MKTIYFVRHGETEANTMNLAGLDTGLTKHGQAQAQMAGDNLWKNYKPVDTIVASPLARTKHTAEIIAQAISFPSEAIEYDERVREAWTGDYEGHQLTPELRQLLRDEYLKPENEHGIETAEQVRARIEALLRDLLARPEETILVVGHNFSGRWLRRVINGLDHNVPVGRFENGELAVLLPLEEATESKVLVL
jgi:2,3-bisphosphoglycerate-dependent phosphoglycerate mutase